MTNMDEQNRVEDIDRVDGGSTSEQKKAMMAENSQAQNGQSVQSVQAPYSQVAQPAQSLYQHMPQYGQPVQQPYQPQSQYGQPAQQPYQPQSQYSQGAQPMQTPYQQMPQYGQPTQQPYQQMPQYGQPTQQPYQPQSQYGQPVQPTPYNNPMGYMGYENRHNIPGDVKKGSTHVPNVLNLIGIIMAVVSVFIPYAYMGTDARSIVGVFGINVLSMLVVAVVIIADVICAFINKAGCSQDRDFRSNTLCAVSGAVFSNRINDRTNLFKAIYTVDWKSEFFKLYLPLHLQRAHHLARSFQLTKTDVTSRKKHKTIRHTVHRLGRKL